MAFYMIKTEDRNQFNPVSICVKNKETALAVAKFVTTAMYGSCESYDCGDDVARYNRKGLTEEDGKWGMVYVSELEVVG